MAKSKPRGRPSSYTEAMADEICNRISDGESLRSICADEHTPDRVTVFRWLSSREDFRIRYARAREEQADLLADEILAIADDGSNDTYVDPESGKTLTDQEVIARSRLRVDARKWLAGKLRPKVYGDKVQQEVTGSDGGAVQLEVAQKPPIDFDAIMSRASKFQGEK